MIPLVTKMEPARIVQVEDAHDSKQFNKKFPVTRGEGAVLYDHLGNAYIDCIGGHGVSVLGYNHPRIKRALCSFLEAGHPISCGHFYDEHRAALIEKLVSLVPPSLSRVFLSNSGTEAIEAGLKFAMKHRKDVKNKEIIAFKRGFHGRTLGALSATFEPRYKEDYSLIPGVSHASYNDIDSVRALVTANTVAIIVELVQGEGGVFPASPGFPAALRELCNEKNIVLIFDEVQTGFGRTGTLFALEHWGVTPDILCLAKGIAAGIPAGATIATAAIMDGVSPGSHGTTFGGSPLACAAGVESLDIIRDEDLLGNASKVGAYMFKELDRIKEQHDAVREVRGKGLMIGIQCRGKVADTIKALQGRGVLALNAGITVVRLLPPLVITMDQARQVIEALDAVL